MTGVIILAAGASIRLGRAKQTLLFKGKILLNHSIETAIKACVGPVVVVIGANENEIFSKIEKKQVTVVVNKNWKDGMSSSISKGVSALLKTHPDAENVILMVCDQPYVDENLLNNLKNTKCLTNKPIVACAYKNTIGVPALFGKQFFDELRLLKGEAGAKKILLKNISSVASIPFERGMIDIDTMTDYEALNNQETF